MAISFLVEFRLRGYSQKYAKWARAHAHQEAKRLRIKELKGRRPVSHITLFGSAETNNLRQVIREVEGIGRRYTLVPFKIGGFGSFKDPKKNVLCLNVGPSPKLEQFRYELAQSLLRISTNCKRWDRDQKYSFHSTIGEYHPRDNAKFEKLCNRVKTQCSLETFKQRKASIFGRLFNIIKKYVLGVEEEDLNVNQHLLRVTILGKGSRIQREYDLVLKRSLSRRQALSRYWWRKTIDNR